MLIKVNKNAHAVLKEMSEKEHKNMAELIDSLLAEKIRKRIEIEAALSAHTVKHSYMTCRKAFFEHEKPGLTAEQIAFYTIPGNMRFFLDKRKAEYESFKVTYMQQQREMFKERRRTANRNFYIRRTLQNDKARV